MLEVLEVPEGLELIRRVLLCMLEAVEGELCLLEVLEVMRSMLLRSILDAAEGRLCSLEVLEVVEVIRRVLLFVLEVMEVIRRVLLFMLEVMEEIRRVLLFMPEAVEGELCLPKVLEVMSCVPLCTLYAVEVGSVCWRCCRWRRGCNVCCSVCWRPWR